MLIYKQNFLQKGLSSVRHSAGQKKRFERTNERMGEQCFFTLSKDKANLREAIR